MRFIGIALLSVWSVAAFAQVVIPTNSSGAETVTSQNATALGFAIEFMSVDAGVRVRVSVPDTIHNGFEYAYTAVQVNSREGKLVLLFRPELNVDIAKGTKYVQFAVPGSVLACLQVGAIYLNPERPMHSDYFMNFDFSTFPEAGSASCDLSR